MEHWAIEPSAMSQRTINANRKIFDSIDKKPNPNLRLLDLALGDPTASGILKPPPVLVEAVVSAVSSGKHNGYLPLVGSLVARQAIAARFSKPDEKLTADDIILTGGGCSGAIELCLASLADVGDNILSPLPGFVVYQTLAASLGIESRFYKLRSDRRWEIDLEHAEKLIDERTKAILVNNPSNPCGSVWSADHIKAIIEMAERHKLPIIADELYWGLTFSGSNFVSFASQSSTVPILSCRGLAKCYIVPGWRFGWVQINDRANNLGRVRPFMQNNLPNRFLGPCSLIEAAIPTVMEQVPDDYVAGVANQLETIAKTAYEEISKAPGLKCDLPQGGMFLLVELHLEKFSGIPTVPAFLERLIKEQSVACYPALSHPPSTYIRIALICNKEDTREACSRIVEFCRKNVKEN